MSKRNDRRHAQKGAGFSSLYGLNQPSFHDAASPSYYNNHYGFSETQLRPFNSGHGTVGDGYGLGVNQGQAHYSLPMSGAGRKADLSETSSDWSDPGSYEWSETSSDDDVDLDDYRQRGGSSDDDEDEELDLEDGDDDVDLDDYRQRGGSHTGDHALPWRWFNPSTPMSTQAINANNPFIPKVGPSGNSPTFDSSNLVGGGRRSRRSQRQRQEQMGGRRSQRQRQRDDTSIDY
jgi:hypothetical protein